MYRQLEDLGGKFLSDDELKNEVIDTLQAEAMTPAKAYEKINIINNNLSEFVGRLRAVIKALGALNVLEEDLIYGDVELGVLIPRKAIENNIRNLALEIREIDEIFKLFSVVATGTREEFEIYYISSSDPQIFIKSSMRTAVIIGAAVTWILSTLNNVADLKIKYDQIIQDGITEKSLTGFKKEIDEKIKNELEKMSVALVKQYANKKSKQDLKEDENRVRKAIKRLAPRLERDYLVGIRMGELEEPLEDDDGENIEHSIEELELYETLKNYSHELKSIESTGEPVLALPKLSDSDD